LLEGVAAEVAVAYRLLALDMDGTLLNGREEISPANAEWIRRAGEAGVTVCLSTGRGYDSALPYAEQLGLDTPMITVNGGEVWRRPRELHRRVTMSPETVLKLHRVAERHGSVWFWAYATDGIYNKESWTNDVLEKEWLKFGYHTEDARELRAIWEEISEWGDLEISNSAAVNIEVNPKGVSKAAGMAEVCRLLGCNLSEAVAIGDSLNDIAAIRAAGLGVAMGNAQDAVKAAADAVTGTNEEDGVAQAIRKYVLKA